ncbi:MAG: hypothetical protein ACM32O_19435 [Clostridia bacterium]
MKKWVVSNKSVIAAVLYGAVVIGGFTAYDQYFADETEVVSAAQHDNNASHNASANNQPHEEAEQNGSSHGHESGSTHQGTSEVNVFVQSKAKEIKIFLKDKTGNPVHDLEINHEKLLHLIVVDEHLEKYYHLHPEQAGNGEFRVEHELPEGFYKAFVDIKPKHEAYHVAPVPFIVGNPSGTMDSHNEERKADSNFTQSIDGETVNMRMSSAQANQPVTLTFDLDQSKLAPYLGAMGHVVILDEYAQNYLHVHPANEREPIFETEFTKPGIYKIWAEFKQNGKVRAFPFVVEIRGENEK